MRKSNRPFIPANDYSEFNFAGMNGRLELRILNYTALRLGHISTGPRTIVPARSCPAGCRGF